MPTQTDTTKNPQIEALERDVLDIRNRFARVTSGLSHEALVWSPNANNWSIAQIVEHLNKVGYAIAPALEDAIACLALRGWDAGPYRYTFLERLFIRAVGPNPPFRVPVPRLYVPPEHITDPEDTIASFLVLQGQIDGWLRARGLRLTAIRIPSPANRLLKMSVAAWIHATIAHERYHLLQIEALLANPAFPAR